MIRRLVFAGVAAMAVALAGAAPASAAEAPQAGSLSLSPAPENGVITTASPTVGGEFHMKEGGVIKTITVTVKPTGGQQGAQPLTVKVCGNGAPSCGNKAAVTWSKQVGPIPFNGPHEISASATGTEQFDFDGDQTGTTPVPIAVKVRATPAAPTEVKAVANDAGTEVTVSWNRNAEPDVLYYFPLRQNADGSFTKNLKWAPQPAAGTARVTYKDDNLGAGGQLKYYILALRSYGETGVKDTIPSEPSAAASVKVPAKEIPATTTSSTAPGGGGSTPTSGPRTPPTVPVPTPAELKIGSLPTPIISRGGGLGKVGTGGEFGVNIDDGAFDENLPYGAGTKRAAGGNSGGRGGVSSLRQAAEESSPKAFLIPLSAGAALCVVAFQLRFLNGRVTQPVDLV